MIKVHQAIKSILTNNFKSVTVKDHFKLEDKLQNQKNNQISLDS